MARLPSRKSLMESGVYNILYCFGAEEDRLTPSRIRKWLTIPEVKTAAEKDADRHLAWGLKHGSLDDCEIPHDNLSRAIGKYI